MTGVIYIVSVGCLVCGMIFVVGKGVSKKVFYSKEDLARSIQERTE